VTSEAYQNIIEKWTQLPQTCSQHTLDLNLVQAIFLEGLGLSLEQVKVISLGNGAGLTPDRLIYKELNQPPVLTVELKKRVPELAKADPNNFIETCQNHPLYRSAVGYLKDNGIKQYLDVSNENIDRNRLAHYGWVFNGDFFQLWRRVDGVIFPLTLIQKVTEENLPQLLDQLAYCINEPVRGMITAVWNRKGGVGKTTNTLNIGATLALKNKKVLLIDFDPQNDLSSSLKIDVNNHKGHFENWLLKIKARYPSEHIVTSVKEQIVRKQFSTTPAPSQLIEFNVLSIPQQELDYFNESNPRKSNFYNSTQPEKWSLIQGLIEMLSNYFDYIFIDVFADISDLAAGMLMSCDTLLIPCDYSKKTLRHAADIYNRNIVTVRKKRQELSALHIGPWNLGVVFSNCPSSGSLLENCVQEELLKYNFHGKQYDTRLKIYAQTKLAEFRYCPVIRWQNSPITKLYSELVNEVYLEQNFIDE
jgi:cellulose biosynthesis protein BcsQ